MGKIERINEDHPFKCIAITAAHPGMHVTVLDDNGEKVHLQVMCWGLFVHCFDDTFPQFGSGMVLDQTNSALLPAFDAGTVIGHWCSTEA